ncbi:MAG: geranylgeranylglycerol-phosphate geranylgeranyltransferase [Sphingomonadales bacterium]
MQLLLGFFRLVRLPNLIFIALAQGLFQFAIYRPIYEGQIPVGDATRFWWLMLASVLIAAGGYVINDYFDVNIDEVNKPEALVVDKIIGRRWAMAWHFLLSGSGIICTALALPSYRQGYLLLFNVACVVLLWVYSTRFKKSFLIGNFLIALLVAWSILVVFVSKVDPLAWAYGADPKQLRLYRFALLYGAFAFLATLARELIKDVEDMEGDRRYGGKTVPIVWGIGVARFFTLVWVMLLLFLLIGVMLYLLQLNYWAAFVYGFLLLLLPLLDLVRRLRQAATPADFGNLSRYVKWILLAGIFSMVFFYF